MVKQKDRQNTTGQLIQLGKRCQDQQNLDLDEQSFLAYASSITQFEQGASDDTQESLRPVQVQVQVEARVCQVASISSQQKCFKLKRHLDEIHQDASQSDQVLPLKKRES
ncbi:MAG: hypothetical protein ACOH5I_08640 [Oligoflexus sp.]